MSGNVPAEALIETEAVQRTGNCVAHDSGRRKKKKPAVVFTTAGSRRNNAGSDLLSHTAPSATRGAEEERDRAAHGKLCGARFGPAQKEKARCRFHDSGLSSK